MAYLPPSIIEDTTLPIPLGKDFLFQIKLIEGKWKRGFFPLILYRPLAKLTTMSPDAPNVAVGIVPVGETGKTAFDPLYGEAVDPQMIVDGTWRQPHLSGDLKASDPELYEPDVHFRARVKSDPLDTELKFYGFEDNRGLMVDVPASILDEVEVTAKAGDLLQWGGHWYEVLQVGPNNRWTNTSTALYVGMNCQKKRKGS